MSSYEIFASMRDLKVDFYAVVACHVVKIFYVLINKYRSEYRQAERISGICRFCEFVIVGVVRNASVGT